MFAKRFKISTPLLVLLLLCGGCVRTRSCVAPDRECHALTDKMCLDRKSRFVPSCMTLEEVADYAVRHNLDLYVKQMEYEIQKEIATGAKYEMLPELLYNGELHQRNNNPGSSSESLEPGVPPAPPSVSSDKKTSRWNTTLTWNLLDFGISYYTARQEANATLVQKYEYQRLKQKLILDVTLNFWNAVASKEAMRQTQALINLIKPHETALVRAANSRLVSETRVLDMQDKILENEYKLQEHTREYHFAFNELKRLMGVPADAEFELVYNPDRPYIAELPLITDLEQIALLERPELFIYDIEEKISIDEIRISFLELFPGSSLFAGYHYDENRFLVNNYWNIIGLRTAWDLFSIPATLSKKRAARNQAGLARRNRLALSFAAIAQVHLAYLLYQDDIDRYSLSREMEKNKVRQLNAADRKKDLGRFDFADILEYESSLLEAEIKAWRAYADVQYSLEQLNHAIGLPLYYRTVIPEEMNRNPVEPIVHLQEGGLNQ